MAHITTAKAKKKKKKRRSFDWHCICILGFCLPLKWRNWPWCSYFLTEIQKSCLLSTTFIYLSSLGSEWGAKIAFLLRRCLPICLSPYWDFTPLLLPSCQSVGQSAHKYLIACEKIEPLSTKALYFMRRYHCNEDSFLSI